MPLTALLILVSLFATVFGIVYFLLSYRNKERMALIESGANADLFYTKKKRKTNIFMLSLGLVSIGLAIGIFLGFIFERIMINIENAERYADYPQGYFAMIFLFVGLALIISHRLSRKYEKEDTENGA
jgi:preprotein translocase subunit YajC